jgi:endoglucanase
MKRRDLLKAAAVAGGAALAGWTPSQARGAATAASASAAPKPEPTAADLARKLPRWRGFNLLDKFQMTSNKPFKEADFAMIAEWGFDWVRLPLDYRCWTDKDDPYKLDEKVLKEIDQAVEFGRKHKVHVCICLHRAPGYTVASPPEKLDLWKDEEARKQFDFQWAGFAKRYKGMSAGAVSFDLVNEPGNVATAVYAKPARRAVEAIRKEDPARLIVSDGVQWGGTPVFELADLGIAQSTRGYAPTEVSHYKASWMSGSDNWPEPTWPLKKAGKVIDRKWLQEDRIVPWKKLEEKGVGVHVGEWGCHNRTPHAVVLAWARDCLANWKEAGWGWGLWNLRGSFGILDSSRTDVQYEDFRGQKLDRKLLDLLKEF